MKRTKERKRSFVVLTFGGVFSYIAIWQFLAFVMLVLLVWVNEMLDLGHIFWELPAREFSWMHACIGTGGVLFAAVITIGHTYIQQRQIVRGLLTICTYCHKIQADSELWQRVEEYISSRSSIFFSHGICPACLEVETRRVQEDSKDEGESAGDRSLGAHR